MFSSDRVVDRCSPFARTNGRTGGERALLPRERCLPSPYLPPDTMAGLASPRLGKKPPSRQLSTPATVFPPATKSASSGREAYTTPKLSREYISARREGGREEGEGRLRVCGSLSISTRFAAALTRRKIFAGNRYNVRQTICARRYPINPVIKLSPKPKNENRCKFNECS